MKVIHKFDGFEVREMTDAEFLPYFQPNAKLLFDDVAQIFTWQDSASAGQIAKTKALKAKLSGRFQLNYGVFENDKFIAWSTGYQESPDSFYMMNSAVLLDYRNKGIYNELLKLVVQRATDEGFQKISSRHVISNNAILISKLKAGFKITSFELSDSFGTTIHLAYYPMKIREKVLEYRAGWVKPDIEVWSAMNLSAPMISDES